MVFRLMSPNRLQAVLSAQDIHQARIDFESEEPSELKRLKRYLLGLLTQAQTQFSAPVPGLGEKLLIEVYPEDNGGATVFFITERESDKALSEPVSFAFCDSEAMLCCAKRLFELYGDRIEKSSLYLRGDLWILTVLPMDGSGSPAETLMGEYGCKLSEGALASALIAEHCAPLLKENALDSLAYFFD